MSLGFQRDFFAIFIIFVNGINKVKSNLMGWLIIIIMKKSKIIAISLLVVGTLITVYHITKVVFISPSVQQKQLTQASKVDVKKAVSDLCQADFDSALWDKRYTELFGKKEFKEDTATTDEILFHLLRFTKTRGYFRKNHKGDEVKDGSYFMMMSNVTNDKNGLYNEFNQELTFALQQIIFDEPQVGAQLAKYVKTDLPRTPVTDEESCRSEKEKEEIRRRSSELYRREVVSKKTENQNYEDVSLERIPTHIQVMIPSVSAFEKNKWDAEEKGIDGSNGEKQKFIERKKKEELELIKPLYRGLATYFLNKFPGVSI